jgi:pteridine reductase
VINLSGKRVLVTGGAVRIGRAIALAFAEAGASVAVHYHRSRAEARQLVEELNGLSTGNRCLGTDLTEPGAPADLIATLLADDWCPDILINNASVYRRCPLLKLTEAQIQSDFDINFFAPFRLMREFARQCGRGVIINLLDQRINAVEPSAGSYALAKKSLRDATLAAAVEWAPAIRVNAVAPGIVLPPPGVDQASLAPLLVNVPLLKQTEPAEIAAACLFLAQTQTVTGQVVYVDGGMHLTRPVRPEKSEADYSG